MRARAHRRDRAGIRAMEAVDDVHERGLRAVSPISPCTLPRATESEMPFVGVPRRSVCRWRGVELGAAAFIFQPRANTEIHRGRGVPPRASGKFPRRDAATTSGAAFLMNAAEPPGDLKRSGRPPCLPALRPPNLAGSAGTPAATASRLLVRAIQRAVLVRSPESQTILRTHL